MHSLPEPGHMGQPDVTLFITMIAEILRNHPDYLE
jgi:hypothetical protein